MEMNKDDGKSQSVKFGNQSKDTSIAVGVSRNKNVVSQHSTFSSLRDIWEPRENIPARRPVLIQRRKGESSKNINSNAIGRGDI